ncbi:MAG TPA: nitroreductase [Steroidobacteraceae bacterium]|jgi:nitroreductase|nr:nitroreductase [Steroidobacteraceae bacterium]
MTIADGSAAATVTAAMLSRHTCRAFTDRPVDAAVVRRLLDTARFAPSGGNLQPWIVHVLSGGSMARFRALMAPKVAEKPLGGTAEYHVYPPSLGEPYRSRRFKVGEDMYALIGIARDDRPGRVRQFARNYGFFGAPVGMFFFLDRSMGTPQWSDVGMFMQSLMLLAREQGLETCPQEAWAAWHEEVSTFLGVGPELMLFSGLGLGYGDYSAPINRLRADRAAVEEFARFHE